MKNFYGVAQTCVNGKYWADVIMFSNTDNLVARFNKIPNLVSVSLAESRKQAEAWVNAYIEVFKKNGNCLY